MSTKQIGPRARELVKAYHQATHDMAAAASPLVTGINVLAGWVTIGKSQYAVRVEVVGPSSPRPASPLLPVTLRVAGWNK